MELLLDGEHLTISSVDNFVRDAAADISVSPDAVKKVTEAKSFTDSEIGAKIVYGVNTGFGPMASRIIPAKDLEALQSNLVRSHAVGMGKPIENSQVLAAMLVRLNTLARGYSGVSPQLISHIQSFINNRILPVVPEHGAVGTSGDLVQLAHIALAFLGEGEVMYKGRRQPTGPLLKQLEIQPYVLEPKEGLSLINGTSVMAGIACLICTDAKRLLSLAVRLGALSLELVNGRDDSISEKLHALRPHRGQKVVAQELRTILASSHLVESRQSFQAEFKVPETDVEKIADDVQEFYSIRCIPQILGPVYDALAKTWGEVEVEINSVTDNPIVDWENKIFLHGGNFHGDYIAASIDQLKMTLVKLTMLSERRANFFLNDRINRRFPPFMNLKTPGLTLGLQGLQFVATSTTAQSQSLAFPHYVHSISTNADNQDVVSMGTDAALIAAKVVENCYIVLSIELATLCQGVDFLKAEDQLSEESRALYQRVRTIFPAVIDDRVLIGDLARLQDFVRHNEGILFPWDMRK